MQINSKTTASFEDLLKIFRLLKNDYEVNQKLAVAMLESMGILEDVVNDIAFRLTAIPKVDQKFEHVHLETLIYKIAHYQNNPNSNIKKLPTPNQNIKLALLNEKTKWDLMKLACRVEGRYLENILTNGNNTDVLRLATVWLDKFKEKGNGLHLLPLTEPQIQQLKLKGLHEFLPNIETVKNYPIEKVIEDNVLVINISDFPHVDLTPSILERIKGRKLKMRAGFYYRNKALLEQFPEINIEIDRKNRFKNFHLSKNLTPDIIRQIRVDRNIFEGKFLTAVYRVDYGLLPNEIENIEDIEVLYLSDSSLKTIPYRLHRFKKLKYLFITASRTNYKIKKGLSYHPSLEGIIFRKKDYDRRWFYRDNENRVEKSIRYMPKTLINRREDEIVNLEKLRSPLPIDIQPEIEEIESYSTELVENDIDILKLNDFNVNYPLPIFEEIKNPSNLLSDEEFLQILHLKR